MIMMGKKIPFSPPDISESEINAVVEVLRSGWITSGPKAALFEKKIQEYCSLDKAIAVYSGTDAMELVLKAMGIGQGDEVVTTPYTYAATSNVITHRGAKPVYVDVKKGDFLIDIDKIYDAITDRTKAIITVDIGGVPVDYDAVREVIKAKGREDIVLLSDSAHSFGSKYKGRRVGSQFDFHAFSFHAVKNLTTAEGGAVTFNNNTAFGREDLYRELKVTSLSGQTKDALSKMQPGAWKYDIINDGLKCNMTDIMASIGLAQLERFDGMLEKRRQIYEVYTNALRGKEWTIIPFQKDGQGTETNYHLYTLRIKGFKEEQRDRVITMLAERGIAANVHFIPIPMLSFYRSLGYNIKDYPNTYAQYENEITLPLYSILPLEDAEYVAKELIDCVEKIFANA